MPKNMSKNPLKQTPSQTVGPFFAYALTAEQYGFSFKSGFTPELVAANTPGQAMRIIGQVFDGNSQVIHDAVIEIFQADSKGNLRAKKPSASQAGFKGFARSGTGSTADKQFEFHSIKPGASGPTEAPCIHVIVTMRGLLNHLFTRIYFEDEASANANDAVLKQVPAKRRDTLIAKRVPGIEGLAYRFDIHMQGPQETVFFDW